MRPLRILHADSAPDWRGGQAQVLALVRGLAARGHAQLVAVPTGPLADRVAELGVPVTAFRPRSDLDLGAAAGLRVAARAFRPDVVHLHSARAHATGWWAARTVGAGCIVSRRVDFDVARHPLSALKYRLPVDRFLCISEGVREVLRRAGLPEEKLTVVRSGVDVAAVAGRVEAARAAGRSDAMRARFAPGGVPLVGVVAALAPHKDHATFLRAVRLVLESHPAARFVCAGAGPLETAVHALRDELGLADAVALPGFVDDVPALLGALDVFVLPSYLEGLGTSVLDAQAAGVPVVATRVGGIPEMVEDGVTGLLAPARDPAALARAIGEALRDRAAAQARAERARGTVREFDVERTLEGTEACYRAVLAARGRLG